MIPAKSVDHAGRPAVGVLSHDVGAHGLKPGTDGNLEEDGRWEAERDHQADVLGVVVGHVKAQLAVYKEVGGH